MRRAGSLAFRRPRLAEPSDQPREIQNAKLFIAIETSLKASDRTYCARRLWHDVLKDERLADFTGSRR